MQEGKKNVCKESFIKYPPNARHGEIYQRSQSSGEERQVNPKGQSVQTVL